MDFEDERYVRLYVRDTGTWASWRWEARAVLPLLLRKLDRGGRFEWPPGDDAMSLAAILMMPVKVVTVGLRELARTGTIELGDGWLRMPNFVVGQNAKSRAKTGAERTAEHRARKASQVGLVTLGDDALRKVTNVTPSPALPQPSSTPPTPWRGKRAASKRSSAPKTVDLRVAPVLDAIDRERVRHSLRPLPPSERHERPILTRIEDGVPLEELVLAVELHSRDTDGAGRLNATTPFTGPSGRGPGGWSWSRRLLDEHRAALAKRPQQRLDVDGDALERKRQEAAEWEARQRGEEASSDR